MGPSNVCLHVLFRHDLSNSVMHSIQVSGNTHDGKQYFTGQNVSQVQASKFHVISHDYNPNHHNNLLRSPNAPPRPTI